MMKEVSITFSFIDTDYARFLLAFFDALTPPESESERMNFVPSMIQGINLICENLTGMYEPCDLYEMCGGPGRFNELDKLLCTYDSDWKDGWDYKIRKKPNPSD